MNEIAGFLNNGGVRKRPRALNLYGPYRDQEELENDLLGTARGTARSGRFPKSARSQRTIDRKPSDGTTTPVESDSEEEPYAMDDLNDVGVAFDIQRLPHAYGTKTTETIIEALFNPVKVTDMKYETPFTMYDSVAAPALTNKGIGSELSGVTLVHDASIGKRQNSDAASSFYHYHYSTGSSTSLHTTNTTTSSSKARSRESGSGEGGSKSESRHGSIPEPRVGESVEDSTATATTTTFGGVRGWWRRRTTHQHHEMPMTAS